MPFGTDGIFNRLFNWKTDRDDGQLIQAQRMDQEMDNITAAINDIVQGNAPFKGPVRTPFGTPAAPGMAFDTDPDTGFYRNAENQMGVAAGGTLSALFTNLGPAFADGTLIKSYIDAKGDGVAPRDTASATVAAAQVNGSVVELGGLTYVVDNTATGVNSATFDLGVDGLKPAGQYIQPEHFGAVGDGVTDASAHWDRAIAFAEASGLPLILGNRRYLIASAATRNLASMVTIIGMGAPVLDGGTGVTLFKLVSAGLRLWNVETRNICITDSFNETTGNIAEIDIRDWRWTNTTQFSFRLRINYSSDAFKVGRLILRNIQGSGGLGGMCFSCPIETVDIDGYSVGNIVVPNDNAYFDGDNMVNTGYADGLLLGDDDPAAQDLGKSWSIGRLSVDGINDQRVPKSGGQIASCDGVRLMGRGMVIGQIDVRNVESQYATDTTGVYFKGRDSTIGLISIRNSGAYEGACVFKGARRTSGSQAEGYNISVGILKLFADDDKRRSALYLGPDDIYIGFLSIEGLGGEVEDPNNPGVRFSGSGALIYCENTDKRRLHIGRYSIVNCRVGSSAAAVKLFTLQGFREIKIGPGIIDNVANDKPFSTGTPPPIIQVFHWGGSGIAADVVEIGPVLARNFSGGGVDVRLITLAGSVDLNRCSIWDPVVDGTVNDGIIVSSQADPASTVGTLQVIGGDLSACADNVIILGITPDLKQFISCNGLLPEPAMHASLNEDQSAAIDDPIEYTNGNTGGWDDTTFRFTAPADGNYRIDAALLMRPHHIDDLIFALKIMKSNAAPTETVNKIAEDRKFVPAHPTPADKPFSLGVGREFELNAGEQIFCQFEHNRTPPYKATVSFSGGGVGSFIQIKRVTT